jgi:hypothetical protein
MRAGNNAGQPEKKEKKPKSTVNSGCASPLSGHFGGMTGWIPIVN